MKRTIASAILIASVVATVVAQGPYNVARVSDSADRLKQATLRLAERSLQDILRGPNSSRTDIQDALLAQHLDASATVMVEMVRNRRPGDDVREVMASMTEQSRRIPAFSPESALWRTVQASINDLNRELNAYAPTPPPLPPGPPMPPPRPIIGRISWTGMVDDRVQLVIRGNAIDEKVLSGSPQPVGRFNFTSPLPATDVEVTANKKSGRGSVRVLQQPSRANDFTAVVEIFDEDGGAREYRLDIYWQARGR